MTKMPACKPYTPCIPSPTIQLSQFTAGKCHTVVCAHAPEPYDSAKSKNSGFGVSVAPSHLIHSLISPTYTASRSSSLGNPPISPPTFLHTTTTTIPLQHLNQLIA